MIQANVDTPCTLLDFPTLEGFVEEISNHEYDVVGISSIIPNIGKVQEMCRQVRRYQPKAKIVVGGHIANLPDLAQRIDADHIVQGEGIRWFRQFIGQNTEEPIRHPLIVSGFGVRNMGLSLKDTPGDIAATVIPAVGCPKGCDFCSTSWMFGGKGKFFNFYRTGDELFWLMVQMEHEMGVRSFFMMDENFLLHRSRALRLLELMETHGKSWSLYVFSSADMIRSYTIDQLLRLGVSWVWMGLEGKDSQYAKLAGINTFDLVAELQANGIHVLGSTIIGLDIHTPENIDQVIEHAVRHNTDFHQFMLYTPLPGTPLHARLLAEGRMKNPDEYDVPDIHGQSVLNWRHPSLSDEQTAEFMLRAFNRDFERNGPSTVRIMQTTLTGWLKHKNHPDLRVRDRYFWESRSLAIKFSAAISGTKRYYRRIPEMYEKMSNLLSQLNSEFGWKSRIFSALGGWWVYHQIQKEEMRLASGFMYEPKTFLERNSFVLGRPELPLSRSVASC